MSGIFSPFLERVKEKPLPWVLVALSVPVIIGGIVFLPSSSDVQLEEPVVVSDPAPGGRETEYLNHLGRQSVSLNASTNLPEVSPVLEEKKAWVQDMVARLAEDPDYNALGVDGVSDSRRNQSEQLERQLYLAESLFKSSHKDGWDATYLGSSVPLNTNSPYNLESWFVDPSSPYWRSVSRGFVVSPEESDGVYLILNPWHTLFGQGKLLVSDWSAVATFYATEDVVQSRLESLQSGLPEQDRLLKDGAESSDIYAVLLEFEGGELVFSEVYR